MFDPSLNTAVKRMAEKHRRRGFHLRRYAHMLENRESMSGASSLLLLLGVPRDKPIGNIQQKSW